MRLTDHYEANIADPVKEYHALRGALLSKATGIAREAYAGFLVPPVAAEPYRYPDSQRLAEIRENAAQDTHPGLKTLDSVVHVQSITSHEDKTQMERLRIVEQANAVSRALTDAGYHEAAEYTWRSVREWIEKNGALLGSIRSRNQPDHMILLPEQAAALAPGEFLREPMHPVLPEQSSVSDHWQALILMKNLMAAFSTTFVREWKEQTKDTETYRTLESFAAAFDLTPEQRVWGGLGTMFNVTMGGMDALCKLVQSTQGAAVLKEADPRMQAMRRHHGSFARKMSGFSIKPAMVLEETMETRLGRSGDFTREQLEFLLEWNLIRHNKKKQALEPADSFTESMCKTFRMRYFSLATHPDGTPLLDLDFDAFTKEEVELMMASGLRLTCPARGKVMHEMPEWAYDVFIKFVLPMYQFEDRKKSD